MVLLGNAISGISPLKIATLLLASLLSFALLTSLSSTSSRESWKSRLSQISLKGSQRQPSTLQHPSLSTPKSFKPSIQDVKNNTLGFEKILVLNLPERSDKRDALVLASSLTNMDFTFIDGVKGQDVINKSLPLGQEERKMTDPTIGSWRAHMNAIRSIVENGWSSALILEDDVDWDIHLKSQMLDFAHGSRYLQNATVDAQTHSPYGDGWDILWLGHCHDTLDDIDQRTYVIKNDPTVPANKKLQLNNHDFLAQWPDYSRIVHVVGSPICTFGYALSYRGAQKILYALSVKELKGFFDNALSWWCTGKDQGARCLSAHPPYFAQHKVKGKPGKNSDNNPKAGGAEVANTINIRFSTRLNLEQLLTGSQDYHDSYPRDQDDMTTTPKITKPKKS